MFELMDAYSQSAVIKVIGVGGGGGNAVAHMVTSGIEGVEFMCVNTDAQALKHAKVKTALQIGTNITKGLGAGADPGGRPAGGDGGPRPHRRAGRGLRHAVHHRRNGRRHGHGRRARGGAGRQGARHPDGGSGHQAVRDGGQQARLRRRSRHRGARPSTATRSSPFPTRSCSRCSGRRPRCSMHSSRRTRCCRARCRASRSSSRARD